MERLKPTARVALAAAQLPDHLRLSLRLRLDLAPDHAEELMRR